VDDEFDKGDEFGALESVKASSDLYCPVSGTVVEVNDVVVGSPESVNKDAFSNWLIKVRMSDPSELDDLLDAVAYQAITEK
jgi:glycine cleavage system H protein